MRSKNFASTQSSVPGPPPRRNIEFLLSGLPKDASKCPRLLEDKLKRVAFAVGTPPAHIPKPAQGIVILDVWLAFLVFFRGSINVLADFLQHFRNSRAAHDIALHGLLKKPLDQVYYITPSWIALKTPIPSIVAQL